MLKANGAVAIRFDAVGFSYGGAAILNDARFHVHAGQLAALVGPNGAGKTTIIRLILGLARPGSGKVEVLGASPAKARAKIGYVPQSSSHDLAFPISTLEVVRMGRLRPWSRRASPYDEEAMRRAIEAVGLEGRENAPYSALSGGQKRRALVARALASEPELLILDEPTANMDEESEDRLFSTLRALKGRATVLLVTHDDDFVSALTDAVYCVGGGGVVVRHKVAPQAIEASGHYGGGALKILHDTSIAEGECCAEGRG
jgi:zinc transport system ATP-binding protein